LLLIGIAHARDAKGGFSRDVSQVADGFDGPLAIVDLRGSRLDRLFTPQGRILIPVNGTEASRRAAEIGFTLARASGAKVTVLYVTPAGAGAGKSAGPSQARTARRNDEAVLEDIAALAARYEVKARRTVRNHQAPDEAITREAKRGYDLIVLGANRRPGDRLFLGNTAAAVLDHSETAKLFVAS